MKDNEPLSSITHLIAFFLSVAGLILLVVFSSIDKDPWKIVSFSIYGGSLVLLYLISTIYHLIPKDKKLLKEVMLRSDHSMIYLLIAGTYTPICFVNLRGPLGWSIFGVIWGLAFFGIIIKSVFGNKKDKLSVILYLLMGWLITIAYYKMITNLDIIGLIWLVLGGLFYSFGTIFYFLDRKIKRTRWFGMHEIFHIFVMIGSTCHFFMMFFYIL